MQKSKIKSIQWCDIEYPYFIWKVPYTFDESVRLILPRKWEKLSNEELQSHMQKTKWSFVYEDRER